MVWAHIRNMSAAIANEARNESLHAASAEPERFERYPTRFVLISCSQSFAIYVIGALVLWMLIPLASICYLFYCAVLEVKVLRCSCVNCYYYGKICCFGKGRLCSMIFKKGEPGQFAERQATWYEVLPDFMVMLVPVIGGILLLVNEFSWIVVMLTIALLGLGLPGSALIRGSFACKYCRQKDLGCPAQRLFEKETS